MSMEKMKIRKWNGIKGVKIESVKIILKLYFVEAPEAFLCF